MHNDIKDIERRRDSEVQNEFKLVNFIDLKFFRCLTPSRPNECSGHL